MHRLLRAIFAPVLGLTMLFVVAACNPTPSLPDGTIPVAQNTLADEKALIGLEFSATAVNEVAIAAVNSGYLKAGSPEAIRVADLLNQLRQGVLLARRAHEAGNAVEASKQINAALSLAAEISRLVPRRTF